MAAGDEDDIDLLVRRVNTLFGSTQRGLEGRGGGGEMAVVDVVNQWQLVLDNTVIARNREGEYVRDRFFEVIGRLVQVTAASPLPAIVSLLQCAETRLAPVLGRSDKDRLGKYRALYKHSVDQYRSWREASAEGRSTEFDSAMAARRRELVNAVKAGETNTKKFYRDGCFSFDADDTVRVPMERLEIGRVYSGRVVGIAKFGVFVDIGCEKPGLVHISQIREGFISNVFDEVSMLQLVTVRVSSLNLQRRNFACTMRTDVQLENAQPPNSQRTRNPMPTEDQTRKNYVEESFERNAANIAANLAISVLQEDAEDSQVNYGLGEASARHHGSMAYAKQMPSNMLVSSDLIRGATTASQTSALSAMPVSNVTTPSSGIPRYHMPPSAFGNTGVQASRHGYDNLFAVEQARNTQMLGQHTISVPAEEAVQGAATEQTKPFLTQARFEQRQTGKNEGHQKPMIRSYHTDSETSARESEERGEQLVDSLLS